MDEPGSLQHQPTLAGMALRNGVLMIGPTHWAVAVRRTDGTIHSASRKRLSVGEHASDRVPMLRGPARLAGMLFVLPHVRRVVPEVRFGFESRELIAGMIAGSVLVRAIRHRFGTGLVPDVASGAVSLAMTLAWMRGGEVSAFHGAEHKAIGGYEQGIAAADATREHERCGTQLAVPAMVLGAAASHTAVAVLPSRPHGARLFGQLVGIAAATELFRANQRGNGGKLGTFIATAGRRLQTIATTSEPSREQLDVAEVALAELLDAERVAA